MRCPKLVEPAKGLAGDVEGRYAVAVGDDLDLTPRDLAPPAGLQGLEKCFFRRKTSSE